MGRRVETCYETNAGFEYDPYGRIIRMDGATDKIPFRYQSKWDMDYGTESTTQFSWGLVDYGLRFYQPKHGRFINRDPIGEAGGLNLYEAFLGDPLNCWDFLGLKQSKVFDDDNKSDGDAPFSDKVYDLPAFEVRGDPDENFDRMPISFFGGQGIPGRTFSNRMGFQPRAGEVGSVTFNDNWRFSYYEYEGDIYITEVEGPEAQSGEPRNEVNDGGLRAGNYTSASGFYRVTVLDNGMIVSRSWWGLGKENIFWASPQVGFKHLQGMLGRDRAMLAAGAIIIAWPGDDPKRGPQGTEWRGRDGSQPGDGSGNYYNPDTGESYRPHLHSDDHDPHWDYHNRETGERYRIYPDGRTEPKP